MAMNANPHGYVFTNIKARNFGWKLQDAHQGSKLKFGWSLELSFSNFHPRSGVSVTKLWKKET